MGLSVQIIAAGAVERRVNIILPPSYCALVATNTKTFSQNMKKEDQQDVTIRCLLLTSVSTCLGHRYAHLQENKGPVTAFGVLFWFCWMWLVAVVGRCVAGCKH